MDRNNNKQPEPGVVDEALFRRVWSRVKPPEGEIAQPVIPELPMPQLPVAPDVSTPMLPERPTPVLPVAPRPTPVILWPETEGEQEEEEVGCLGPESARYAPKLQQFISQAIRMSRACTKLSKKLPASLSRTMTELAAREKAIAKRLAAAYFLISGVRYWPVEQGDMGRDKVTWSQLRQCYQAYQRRKKEFQTQAKETTDVCLSALYIALAQEMEESAWLVRGMLEQL